MSGKVSLGDIIVSVDDRTVRTIEDLFRTLSKKRPGQTVKLQLLRSFGGTLSQSNRVLRLLEPLPDNSRLVGLWQRPGRKSELARSLRKVDVDVQLAGR